MAADKVPFVLSNVCGTQWGQGEGQTYQLPAGVEEVLKIFGLPALAEQAPGILDHTKKVCV